MSDTPRPYVILTDDPLVITDKPFGPMRASENGEIYVNVTNAGVGPVSIFDAENDTAINPLAASQRYALETASILFAWNQSGQFYERLMTGFLDTFNPGDSTGYPLMTSAGLMAYDADLDDGSFSPIVTITANDGILAGYRTLLVNNQNFVYNGTTWSMQRSASASLAAASTKSGVTAVAGPGDWSINHTPAANTQATITRAAGAAGVRHICTSISGTLNALTTAAETTVLVNVRDGATGAGTILWSTRLHAIPGGTTGFVLSGLNIVGSAATAMTIEFAAAGGADTFESVAITGHDVS